MITPAKEGMTSIIEAAVANKVKRIVVTSSLATVFGNAWKKDQGVNHYDENDFAPIKGTDSYGQSKIAQETVIREFLAIQDSKECDYKLEIVTLHPTFIIGPSISTEATSSVDGIAKIMRRDIPGLPHIVMPSVDVRDCAAAHYVALFKDGIQGQRFIINNESIPFRELSMILDQEFKQYGYRVQTR